MEILVFELAGRLLGVPCGYVIEVLRAVKLSPLPAPSAAVEGLLNLRGRIVRVVDLRGLFRLDASVMKHTDHLIVIGSDARLVALRVDRAIDLAQLAGGDPMQAVAGMLTDTQFVQLVGQSDRGIVHVLDAERLLSIEDGVSAAGLAGAERSC
jgi:purine-binding chemotaxis protein CheW